MYTKKIRERIYNSSRGFTHALRHMKLRTYKEYKLSAGFTLIEILVSLSIVVALSAVVLWNQTSVSSQVALGNAIQEILVRIREAQVYGVGVRVADDGSTGTFNLAYGFQVEDDGDYILIFVDRNDDGEYDGTSDCVTGATEECVEKFVFAGGITTDDICGTVGASSNEKCSPQNSIDRLNVTFKRPNPKAHIEFPGASALADEYAAIQIKNQSDDCRRILIYNTGQITTGESCV